MSVVAVVQAEVRKCFLLLGFYADLWVAPDYKEIVVDCGLFISLIGNIDFLISQRNDESLLVGQSFRFEDALIVASNAVAVDEFNNQDKIFPIIDVAMNIGWAEGIVSVDEPCVFNFDPHIFLDWGFEEEFVFISVSEGITMEKVPFFLVVHVFNWYLYWFKIVLLLFKRNWWATFLG